MWLFYYHYNKLLFLVFATICISGLDYRMEHTHLKANTKKYWLQIHKYSGNVWTECIKCIVFFDYIAVGIDIWLVERNARYMDEKEGEARMKSRTERS